MPIEDKRIVAPYTPKDVASFVFDALNQWPQHPEKMLDYFAIDASWEFPWAPQHLGELFPNKVTGHKNILAYFTKLTEFIRDMEFSATEHWDASALLSGSETTASAYLLRYDTRGHIKIDDKNYDVDKLVGIARLNKEGKIESYIEYWNPYIALKQFGLIKDAE